MKKILRASFLLILSFTLTFCSGDDSNSDNNQAPEGQLVATIDGELFNPPSATTSAALQGEDIFNISGLDQATGELITITIQGATEGTFDIGYENTSGGTAAYNVNGENAFLSAIEGGSGQLTISELDLENETASGTFNFIAIRQSIDGEGNITTETIEITDGAFNQVPLVLTIQGEGNSSLEAEIDGEPLNADTVIAIESEFNGDSFIQVTAYNNTVDSSMGLRFPSDITEGEYEIGGFFSDYQGSYNPSIQGGNAYLSSSGTLTITGVDSSQSSIEGTFNFVADHIDPQNNTTVEVTNGTFSIVVQ